MNSLKPVTVLLIDDDEDDREFFKIAATDVDIELRCLTASGAKEALKMLDNAEVLPDFIFLDLNMPGIDGRVCLQHLKSNASTATIPVVIFSTSSVREDIEQTKALGAMDFMTKPPDISDLSVQLNNFFSQHIQK